MSESEPEDTSVQALGGKARAAVLSPQERSEIARRAAAARWDKASGCPQETHTGEIQIGAVSLPCAVLDNGKRILKTMGITRAFGSKKKTANKPAGEGLPQPPAFLASDAIRAHMSPELLDKLGSPLAYRPAQGGSLAFGYEADLLPSICDAILDARRAKALRANQKYLCDSAELLLRGLARVGIVALVDEATGYQYDRARHALAEILERFIAKELAAWVKTFDDDYYSELFRLRGLSYSEVPSKKPAYIGHLTNDIIYKRLAPGVLDELRKMNPRVEGGRKDRHHQWLTREAGHPKLREHLVKVTILMKAAGNWDEFKATLDRVLPQYGRNYSLPSV
jgi:hypothetical protein